MRNQPLSTEVGRAMMASWMPLYFAICASNASSEGWCDESTPPASAAASAPLAGGAPSEADSAGAAESTNLWSSVSMSESHRLLCWRKGWRNSLHRSWFSSHCVLMRCTAKRTSSLSSTSLAKSQSGWSSRLMRRTAEKKSPTHPSTLSSTEVPSCLCSSSGVKRTSGTCSPSRTSIMGTPSAGLICCSNFVSELTTVACSPSTQMLAMNST
mmetsp:Transcript_19738/g.46445  ORF Transcript_19738/g.46445 Transcript_19738/m.46445 type:complete len:212 (+) Transcript_19738:10617-11252(+)